MKAQFDHEKLDVYQLELKFIAWVTPLLDEVGSSKRRTREVADQLDRASLSSLLNTAEGNGRRQRQVRSRFLDDARGSATESAACLDALVAKGAVTPERILEGKEMLLRIVSMLCRLIDRFDSLGGIREQAEIYRVAEWKRAADDEVERKRTSRTRTRTRTRKTKYT